jgi:hypothetical protein
MMSGLFSFRAKSSGVVPRCISRLNKRYIPGSNATHITLEDGTRSESEKNFTKSLKFTNYCIVKC